MSRHRWKWTDPISALCHHCGAERWGVNPPYLFRAAGNRAPVWGPGMKRPGTFDIRIDGVAYSLTKASQLPSLPRCAGAWPDGWRPRFAELVRPDLFPVQQADAADLSPGDAASAAASAAIQEH